MNETPENSTEKGNQNTNQTTAIIHGIDNRVAIPKPEALESLRSVQYDDSVDLGHDTIKVKASSPTITKDVGNKGIYQGAIPVIIITEPDTDLDLDLDLHITKDNKTTIPQNEQLGNETYCSAIKKPPSLLTPPTTDVARNIARPPDPEADSSVDSTSNEEGFRALGHCSSTPRRKGDADLNGSDCSMVSLDSASPIAPADSSLETPNISSNHCLPNDSLFKDTVIAGQDIHAAFLTSNQLVSPCALQTVSEPNLENISTISESRLQMPSSKQECPYSEPNNESSSCSSANTYVTCVQDVAGNDFLPSRDSSWTDLSYRCSDILSNPSLVTSFSDPSYFPGPSCGLHCEVENFVYPSIYVSSAGLISVLLRNDMSVEMTVDRTIRVVSHNHMMAVATDSRGTAACLYHPTVKVFQMGTTTDIATQSFRAQMGGGDSILFSNGVHYFKLEDSELQPIAPLKFTDIFKDQSVNLLFSSEGYGEALVASCMQVAAQAEYANLPKGGVIVRINGVKVTQTGSGDVTVVTGAKFIRLSPHLGTTRLGNRFIDVEIEKDWSVKLTRGAHSFTHTKKRTMVCNGKMQAGFDQNNGLKVINLQPRHPLLAEPLTARRPISRNPVRTFASPNTPKRRPGIQTYVRGGFGSL